MKQLSLSLLSLGLILCFLATSCKDPEPEPSLYTRYEFDAATATDIQAEVQEALILMNNGDTIYFKAGTYQFTGTLTVDGKDSIVVTGEGADNTILSFENQTSGAQGIQASSTNWILFTDFTIQDAIGDNIKIKDSDGVSFINVNAIYNGPADETNGAYALYPVTCQNVLIDNCYIRGASDAGIYVGQSEHVIVRNNTCEENVAGIEIENCNYSDVYGNIARNNTGGILVFDLPGLPVIKNGTATRVYNNQLIDNSHRNFAPAGNMVGSVPPGTGVMVLASNQVEIFDNTFTNNNLMGLGVISYMTLVALAGEQINDSLYDPYTHDVTIRNNSFERTATYPSELNDMGNVLANGYPNGDIPDIVHDGFADPAVTDPSEGICLNGNNNYGFVDLGVPSNFATQDTEEAHHTCTGIVLDAVTVNAPGI